MNQLHRAEITVHGDVQTVGYRYAVKRVATKLKIQGYIQNMPDGTIKIVAEAPKNTITKFIKEIQIKEPPIIVERIDTKYAKSTGKFKFFTIKYGDLTEEMAEGFGTGLSYINISRAENKQGFQMLRDEIRGSRDENKHGFQMLRDEIRGSRDEMRGGFQGLKKEFTVSRTETKRGFQDLKEEFGVSRAETKQGFQGLKTEIKGMREDMNNNFKEMSTKYDAISNSLSEAVKAIQIESVKTRTELIRAVDNLSRLVHEFIKETRRRRQERN